MNRKKAWLKIAVYIIVGLLLIGCVFFSAYLMIFQIGPALAGQGARLETARNIATILNGLAPLFTTILVILGISDRFARRRAEEDSWTQQHFNDLVSEIEKLVDVSDLRRRRARINELLFTANGGAVWAEQKGHGIKDKAWGLITNAMKDYDWNLPPRTQQIFEDLSSIARTANRERAKLVKRRVCAKTQPELCGWILVDACARKNTELLKAAHILGVDSVAIDNFKFPFPGPPPKGMENLETLRKMIEWLVS